MVSVLLSASVERCFVSERTRNQSKKNITWKKIILFFLSKNLSLYILYIPFLQYLKTLIVHFPIVQNTAKKSWTCHLLQVKQNTSKTYFWKDEYNWSLLQCYDLPGIRTLSYIGREFTKSVYDWSGPEGRLSENCNKVTSQKTSCG